METKNSQYLSLIPWVLAFILFFSNIHLASAGNPNSEAQALLKAKSGSRVKGRVLFVPQEKGVKVTGRITGLKPNSTHGFHVHEKGDCSSADAKSAGGHFNPKDVKHGSPSSKSHHTGDLGNVKADKYGNVELNNVYKHLSLDKKAKHSIVAKAVVLHEKADDLESQPSGDAGARIACGVIQ